MFGITSEGALSQARILLVLAIIWLILALITRRHRTLTVIIYAGIGTLFELFGLYNVWTSLSGFSLSGVGPYIMAVFLFLLFILLIAVIWIRYQGSQSSAGSKYLSVSYSGTYTDKDRTAPDQFMMADHLSGYLPLEHDPEENNGG